MKKTKLPLAAIIMAAILLAITGTASAQTPAAPAVSASASASATPAPASAPSAPASKAAMFCTSNLSCLAAKDLFVNMGVQFGTNWAKGVREALDTLVSDQTTRADLENLPEGATNQMAYLGKEPMDRTAFDAYLATNDCTTTGAAETKKASAGCDVLAAKLAPMVKAAIDASQAEAAVKANAAYLYEKATGGLIGDQKIAMLHLAGLMLPFGEWAKAFGLADNTGVLVGKSGCFLRSGEEAKCGVITAADSSGVTIGSDKVGWDKLQKGGDTVLAIGDTQLIGDNWGKGKGNSFASQHPVSLEIRGFLRAGSAQQYESAAMGGAMLVGRLHLSDNFSVHGGLGMLGASGQSQFGVTKGDSPTMFAAMIGAEALLGSVYWPVAPVLEANATFQGVRPGVEGGLGAVILPSKPLNFRILGTLGYYPTGRKLFTHPDKATEDFNLFGAGITVGAAYTF